MTLKTTASALMIATATAFGASAWAADTDPSSHDPALTKSEAKKLKIKNDARYDARKNVSEANEDLAKADCKTALEGSAKRACQNSARAAAKSSKANAKTLHEIEAQKIEGATK